MSHHFLKCLIVDDERHSRDYIRDLLQEYLPDRICLEAHNGTQAIQQLTTHQIELLFLDVSMPGIDGFEVLKQVEKKSFKTIFITAHSQYTLQALREEAFDYLLKPIKKSEFKIMLERVLKKISEERAFYSETANHASLEQLLVTHQNGLQLITLTDILYLKADNTYTTIMLTNGQKLLTSKPINQYEKSLVDSHFFRVHKSYLINLFEFTEIQTKNGMEIKMTNNEKLPVSRYRQSDFLARIKTNPNLIKP